MFIRMRKSAFVVATAVLAVLSHSVDSGAQELCTLLPGEVGITEQATDAAESVMGVVSEPDGSILSRSGPGWVAAPGVVAAGVEHLARRSHREVLFTQAYSGTSATCYPVGKDEDLDLAYLRCDGLDSSTAVARLEPISDGSPVYMPAVGASLAAEPLAGTFTIQGVGYNYSPVFDQAGEFIGVGTGSDTGSVTLMGEVERCPTTTVTAAPEVADRAASYSDRPATFESAMLELFTRRSLILGVPMMLFGLLKGHRRDTGVVAGGLRWAACALFISAAATAVQWAAFGTITTPL